MENKKYLINEPKLIIVSERAAEYITKNEANIYNLINDIRKGITYDNFEILVNQIPFTINEWAEYLHINARTMLRYKTDNKTFDTPQTERVFQISRLYKKGLAVFEDKKNFDIWLNSNNISLGNITPKSLLDSSFGVGLVNDTLTRIEHGVLA